MTAPEPTMRILKYIFIVSILLFIFVTIQVPSRVTRPPQQPIELILILLALLNLAMGLNARRLFARLGLANAKRGAQSTPLNQWFTANIWALAMIESCALFAVVLHMLGSSAKMVALLFGCSLLGLIIWSPGTPPTLNDPGGISL
jgi:hypothetical protein